jgi:hypothetical protein
MRPVSGCRAGSQEPPWITKSTFLFYDARFPLGTGMEGRAVQVADCRRDELTAAAASRN